MKDRKYLYLTAVTIAAFLAFRIFYIATTHYNLAPDEAYFWDWSRHPALSYYDQGPMVAWIIRFFTGVLPLSEFSVRMGAPVFAALTTVVIYILTVEITGYRLLGFMAVLLFHLTPISTAGGVIMTYYSPQMLFMSLTALFLWRLVRDGKGWWWYLIGLSLGLGFLSHHMFIFFTAEVGLFILLSANNRKWLIRKEPYLALLIEASVASPVLIWNQAHNFVMFRHATGMMTTWDEVFITFLKYVGGLAGVQTPLFFLAVLYGLSVSAYRGIKFKDDKHLMLFSLSAPLIFFIALLSLGGRTEANWPISGYITGTISAVYVLYEKYKNGIAKLLINASLVFTILLCVILSAAAYYPSLLYSAGVNLPPHQDPANRLYGWKDLGEEVSGTWGAMPRGGFVATNEYGINAELAFYVKGNPQVFEIPVSRRASQYDFWNDFEAVKGKDAVFAGENPMPKEIEALFERVEPARHIEIHAGRSNGVRRNFYIYKCYGYKGTAGKTFAF